MQRFILILLTGLFWSNVSSAEFKLPDQNYSEIKSVYSYGDKKLIVVSEEMFESIWIYDPLTNKQIQDDVKYTDEQMEADAAIDALYKCKLNK